MLEALLRSIKAADVLLTLLFSTLGSLYIRAKATGLSREAEEKRVEGLRGYIGDQERLYAGLRNDYERLQREMQEVRDTATRQREDLTECLMERFAGQAYTRVLVAALKMAGVPVPPRDDGEEG